MALLDENAQLIIIIFSRTLNLEDPKILNSSKEKNGFLWAIMGISEIITPTGLGKTYLGNYISTSK
ncbi:MAG: hypothetical protein IBX56_02975 [Methylomicrobium sp.]|nr:hypothetical protein [Methylomicrobium sp.]